MKRTVMLMAALALLFGAPAQADESGADDTATLRGGPIAVSLAGFRRYQESDAWTWEHMALTRAASWPCSRLNSRPTLPIKLISPLSVHYY